MNNTFKYTIMVVEDEGMLLQAISKKLEVSEIKAITFGTGQEAVDYINNGTEIPDAVWLDFHLPDMDGIAILRVIKASATWEKIPVYVISNSANEQVVKEMIELGAKRYILKAEHRLDEIVSEIVEFIKTQEESISN